MRDFGDLYRSRKIINKKNITSKDQIINKAFEFHLKGNISEATKHYQYFINQGFEDCRVFSNYGLILQNIGKLKEAELYTRKFNSSHRVKDLLFLPLNPIVVSVKKKSFYDFLVKTMTK